MLQLILFLFAVSFGGAGLVEMIHAETVFQQIVGAILFVCGSVFLSSAFIVQTINDLKS